MADSAGAGAKAPARPWTSDPLDWLIGPTSREVFFDTYYERLPLVVSRDEPGRFRELLSIAAIDRLVASADLREGMLDLADASREMSRQAYLMDGGVIDRGVIAHEYGRGATIILQQLHQADPTLAAFCRSMEALFSCHVQTNIYLTPPNAQGFRTHYDNHDVFVIQVEGEKRWRFYNQPVDAPYRGERYERGRYETGEITAEFVMKAGDCAYVPRGLMHDASTSGDQPSLHVTCGLIVKTWAELVLEAVSEVALKDPELRRSLPVGYARPDFDRSQMQAKFARLVGGLPGKVEMDSAFELMVDSFIRSRDPDVAGAIVTGAGAFDPAQRFVVRADAPWRLAEDGDDLVLIAPGGDLDFKPEEAEAARRAMNGEPFAAADLNAPDPQAFIRKLRAFGVVRPA